MGMDASGTESLFRGFTARLLIRHSAAVGITKHNAGRPGSRQTVRHCRLYSGIVFITIKKVSASRKDGHAFIFQKNDESASSADFRQRGFQHLRSPANRMFADQASVFEPGLQHDLQVVVFFGADISARCCQNNNFGNFSALMLRFLEKFGRRGIRTGPAALDEADAKIIQARGDLQFYRPTEKETPSFCAPSLKCVVEIDFTHVPVNSRLADTGLF